MPANRLKSGEDTLPIMDPFFTTQTGTHAAICGHAWSEQYRAYGAGAAAVTVDLARVPRHWGARRADTDANDYKTVQQEDFKTWSDVFRIAGQGRQAVRGCAGAHPQRPPRAVPAATGLPILLSAPAYVRSRTILIAWRRQ
ncbi:hypothetical protein FJT64_021499 [Amphibalanus amphitrite]|uniref:Uncharacterized protein n=1 Tax=Amphibalanus amphitrite TaxID=1232801 RepID=A0A6A4WHY0_AMPAM|nr:hypothetical protein FJT64_021499 [Amphibalanus amphitrite]